VGEKKERDSLLARQQIEDKAKQCLSNGPNQQRGLLVGDLRLLLRWKMAPAEFLAEKVSSAPRDKLLQLWEVHHKFQMLLFLMSSWSLPSLHWIKQRLAELLRSMPKWHSRVLISYLMKLFKAWYNSCRQ
jgi:hypothetical protein